MTHSFYTLLYAKDGDNRRSVSFHFGYLLAFAREDSVIKIELVFLVQKIVSEKVGNIP